MSGAVASSAFGPPPGWRRRLLEVGALALVYLGYSLARVLADDSLKPALLRARQILGFEALLRLDLERGLNQWFLAHGAFGVSAAFYYATAHYVATVLVLLWLFRHRPGVYTSARSALIGATAVALLAYLLIPTAPPRLMSGYADLLAVHAGAGWWGNDASVPQGFGWMSDELAAFPSMHAGWALWIALAVNAATPRLLPRLVAWSHTLITAVVVVGTGNHWVLDVVAGWVIVTVAWRSSHLCVPGHSKDQPAANRDSADRTRAGSVVVHIGGNDALRNPP